MSNRCSGWNPNSRSEVFVLRSNNVIDFLDCSTSNQNSSNQGNRLYNGLNSLDESNFITCIDWYDLSISKPIIAYGTTIGSVNIFNFSNHKKISAISTVKNGRKLCNSLQWNKLISGRLSVSFDSVKGNENGGTIYDIEKSKMWKIAFGESSSSTEWIPGNPNLVAFGTTIGWVKLYDDRVSIQAVHSILAHPSNRPRRVKGIRCDPFNFNVFASFSDAGGELVRVWDLRRTAHQATGATPSLSFQPRTVRSGENHELSQQTPLIVTDVGWSTTKKNIIAVATSTQKSISFYSSVAIDRGSYDGSDSSLTSPTSSNPLYSVDIPDYTINMSWRNHSLRMQQTYLESQKSASEGYGLSDPMSHLWVQSHSQTTNSKEDPAIRRIITTTNKDTENIWDVMTFECDQNGNQSDWNEFLSASQEDVHSHLSHNKHDRDALRFIRTHVKTRTAMIGENSRDQMLVTTSKGVVDIHLRDRNAIAFSTNGVIAVAGNRINDTKTEDSNTENAIWLFTNAGWSCNCVYQVKNNKISCRFKTKSTEPCFEQINSVSFFDNYEDSINILNNIVLNYTSDSMMYFRCRVGYSFHPDENTDILSCELNALHSLIHILSDISNSKEIGSLPVKSVENLDEKLTVLNQIVLKTIELYRMWLWIDRIETLNSKNKPLSLANCGILRNITEETPKDVHQNTTQSGIGSLMFVSEHRNMCRVMCGWTPIIPTNEGITEGKTQWTVDRAMLVYIVEECDSFERSAALALWHGDLDKCVSILQEYCDKFNPPLTETNSNSNAQLESSESFWYDTENGTDEFLENEVNGSKNEESDIVIDWDFAPNDEYIRLISLLSMCFAGFTIQTNPVETSFHTERPVSTWMSMCMQLKAKLLHCKRRARYYLVACCSFLLSILKDRNAPQFDEILYNEDIALEDKAAFGCTYLPHQEVLSWLTSMQEKFIENGKLEGLLLTGIEASSSTQKKIETKHRNSNGLLILQNFLDISDDLQTVSLLTSQNISQLKLNSSSVDNRNSKKDLGSSAASNKNEFIEQGWLQEYRNLLNKWELYTERAFLDVELGKKYRKLNAIQILENQIAAAKKQSNPKDKSRMIYQIPSHNDYFPMFILCTYCTNTLPIDSLKSDKTQKWRDKKPMLYCCASCKNIMPRCYVCQYYMGMANPYGLLEKTMNEKRNIHDQTVMGGKNNQDASNTKSVALSDGPTIDMERWFFFCQRCRHGGHTNCITKWFNIDQSDLQTHSNSPGSSVKEDHSKSETNRNYRMNTKRKRFVCGVNGCRCCCVSHFR